MSSRINRLAGVYRAHISVPWQDGLAAVQKIIFAVYDKHDELRLRANIGEIELATKSAGHHWQLIDVTHAFPDWMMSQEYRDSYFECPEDMTSYMTGEIAEFSEHLIGSLRRQLSDVADANTVTALVGVGTLFGLTRVSKVVDSIADAVQGRLVVFFPGEYANNNYRLLDARDGWNYMAVPLLATE